MSKKLKKKIEEICGLKDLSWEARQDRANEILASSEWKQSVCNNLIGLSFRELEQVLSGIGSERQKKEDNDERKLEVRQSSRKSKSLSKKVHANGFERQKAIPNSKPPKARPRSLEEILAQVHAPRVVPTGADQSNAIITYRRQQQLKSASEVSSDSSDVDYSSDEQTS